MMATPLSGTLLVLRVVFDLVGVLGVDSAPTKALWGLGSRKKPA